MKLIVHSINSFINCLLVLKLFLCGYVYRMKTTFYILLALCFLIGCGSYQPKPALDENSSTAADTLRIANDSLEYEIIIIEPGFNAWLATQPPRGQYAQSTMEMRNWIKVKEYNLRVNSPSRFNKSIYVFPIEYERNVNYGYEVNYLLYNYFIFFEKRYNQRLP